MNETHFGYLFDVSWNSDDKIDTIYVDTGHDVQLHFTMDDLQEMVRVLAGYIDED